MFGAVSEIIWKTYDFISLFYISKYARKAAGGRFHVYAKAKNESGFMNSLLWVGHRLFMLGVLRDWDEDVAKKSWLEFMVAWGGRECLKLYLEDKLRIG